MKTTLLIIVLLSLIWLSGCSAASSVTPTNAVADSSVALATTGTGALEVTYLANEGFMLAGGGRKVLIDALFGEGLKGLAVVSPPQRELLEQARAPYTDVDALFATHFHDDHFNAASVLAHLTHNPQAFFFSTNQAAEKLRAVPQFDAVKTRVVTTLPKEGERIHTGHRGIYVQLLNIHHGRGRPIENLGFLIELAGKRILHIGDSFAEATVFQSYDMVKDRIDVAFLPSWYFLEKDARIAADFQQAIRTHIRPRHIVVMHLGPDVASATSGWAQQWPRIKSEFPNAVYFAKELETKRFD